MRRRLGRGDTARAHGSARRHRRSIAAPILAGVLSILGCGVDREPVAEPSVASAGTPPPQQALFPVTIRLPSTLGVIDTDRVDAQGRPIGVRCDTCHGQGVGGSMAARSDLPEFHRGVVLRHGDLTCATCHPVDAPSGLRLADDRRIAFTQVQELCRQCHGPQYRDYVRGSHGGMRGYWDLTRGPRERNACVMCHAAHAPAYPQVIPAPPPRDRFLGRSASSEVHPDD